MPLKKQAEMLEEVAGDALLTIRRRFPECRVELDLSEDILYLPMDPLLVRQVMINLLENAIRHSGDRDHIQMRLYREEDGACPQTCARPSAAASPCPAPCPGTPPGGWASACPSARASSRPTAAFFPQAMTRRAGRCSASACPPGRRDSDWPAPPNGGNL